LKIIINKRAGEGSNMAQEGRRRHEKAKRAVNGN